MWSTERKHDIGDNNVISRAGEDVLAMKIDRVYIVYSTRGKSNFIGVFLISWTGMESKIKILLRFPPRQL